MVPLIDLLLMSALGFLGSFGHCVGMCGPITAAFALSSTSDSTRTWTQQVKFHLLLNLGRMLSYALVGAGIGALGSVLFAGGQMAGVGSVLRRLVAIATGSLLIWFGLTQICPGILPKVPVLHPAARGNLHDRLSQQMMRLSFERHHWTPALLGMLWGLMPCGFLYVAQLKSAETGHWLGGLATMLAFGIGTLPTMLGVGVSTSLMSRDRRSQLFRLGGWITLIIGILILLRTGDTMTDYTGHFSLLCLLLALVARPISRLWAAPLKYRRVLGVGAFVLAGVHTIHMIEHTWNWQVAAIAFMLPTHQLGILAGVLALAGMTPAALTSFDWAQRKLGKRWRQLHLLSVPALILAGGHAIVVGSHYWGSLHLTWSNHVQTAALIGSVIGGLAVRSRWVWACFSQSQWYVAPRSADRPIARQSEESVQHEESKDTARP